MREIKFEYIYSNWKDFVKKTFTLDEISNWDCYEFMCDMPMYKDYKLLTHRQYTWLKDKNWKEIYEWDVVKYEDKTRCKWDDLLINKIIFNIPQHRYWIWKWIDCEKDSSLFIYLTPKNCKKIEKIWNIYENSNLINK